MPQNNKDYCREWHAKNRERSRELAKQYYQRISKPLIPKMTQREVLQKLRGIKTYLLLKEIALWNKKDWKIFEDLTKDLD